MNPVESSLVLSEESISYVWDQYTFLICVGGITKQVEIVWKKPWIVDSVLDPRKTKYPRIMR